MPFITSCPTLLLKEEGSRHPSQSRRGAGGEVTLSSLVEGLRMRWSKARFLEMQQNKSSKGFFGYAHINSSNSSSGLNLAAPLLAKYSAYSIVHPALSIILRTPYKHQQLAWHHLFPNFFSQQKCDCLT